MADTVGVKWIYPPNWDGNPPDNNGWREVTVRFHGISDGTGEADVTKVDISELRTVQGIVPTRTKITSIKYMVNGMSVRLEWDRSPNAVIAILGITAGNDGVLDWGGKGLVDPGEVGDRTGDILLTTGGATSGDTYDITMCIKLKES